jgi:hypothetical protein
MPEKSPLLRFLLDPESAVELDPQAWSLLFAEARACGLLARLAKVFLKAVPDSMPASLQEQLLAAQRKGDALVRDVLRELPQIAAALVPVGTKVALLKGAAYVAAGLPSAAGRIFSDIDVLVAKPFLAHAEAALMLAGWAPQRLSAYDKRYYREWSHEVPPMTHVRRGTTIDLHHSLVMPTCRIPVDVDAMIRAVVPVDEEGTWYRLKDEDLVLHAAAHLLLNAEFDRGLRDLWDLDMLIRHFSRNNPGFGEAVLMRAQEVGLMQVTRQAFTLCNRFFATPLPASSTRENGLIVRLLEVATGTRHPDTRPDGQLVVDQLLLYRELSIRLPWHLLVRHLWHKAITSLSHKD